MQLDWGQIVLVIGALSSFASTVWMFAVTHTQTTNAHKRIDANDKRWQARLRELKDDHTRRLERLEDRLNSPS